MSRSRFHVDGERQRFVPTLPAERERPAPTSHIKFNTSSSGDAVRASQEQLSELLARQQHEKSVVVTKSFERDGVQWVVVRVSETGKRDYEPIMTQADFESGKY